MKWIVLNLNGVNRGLEVVERNAYWNVGEIGVSLTRDEDGDLVLRIGLWRIIFDVVYWAGDRDE